MSAASQSMNPHIHNEYVEPIRSLHQAFVDHVYPPSRPGVHGDPATFDRLPELRAARQSMHNILALGEDLWIEWIQDESMLAKSVDEQVMVMEKCSKAVTEEYGSVKLWIVFGEWLLHTHRLYHQASSEGDSEDTSAEDRLVGREIFSWQVVLDTWRHGAEDTMWRMNDSHQVWNRYMELLMQDLSQEDLIAQIRSLFDARLQIPHADWDGTFQSFSTFISTYFSNEYEEIMVATNSKAGDAKSKFEVRRTMELELESAQRAGDWVAEYTAFANYVQWERTVGPRKSLSSNLTNALYQRAALRFPTDPRLWEDHVLYLVELGPANRLVLPILPILERATRHCPWSGILWAHCLLASEREGQSFAETEKIKHEATSTGLLEVAGMEEVVKVHTAWCSYLRRRAFQSNSMDEDLDVAEMGIRSSIENLQEMAAEKLGHGSNPDHKSRLERIYIRFLTQNGDLDMAREVFRRLISTHGDSWEFWLRFYTWEMLCWARVTHLEGSEHWIASEKSSKPHYATEVLRQATQRENVDWPEKIMDTYITHCEDYTDVDDLEMAMVEVKRLEKVVAKKREADVLQLAAKAQAKGGRVSDRLEGVSVDLSGAETTHVGKRKRHKDDPDGAETSKKSKQEDTDGKADEVSTTGESQNKRDRENATILVQHLPEQVSETRLRQFFRDCGTINSLKVVQQNGTSATVEFDTKEAALFAQTRNGKALDGENIDVQLGSGSTIFVANFPPMADEGYIRELFQRFGSIVDIRFPSLKYNTHRRFCYVQFKFNAQAQAATQLNGRLIDDDLKLVAKISNPAVKQDRSGAMEEGREVYCRNVHWSASEEDIKTLFKKYGEVETVRIPRKAGGQSKGFCFVVFASEEEANAALALNGHSFLSRELHVELSSKGGAKRQATTIISRVDRLKSPSLGPDGTAAAAAVTSPSAASTATPPPPGIEHATSGDRHSRTIALMNIPDTVNDRRIRALTEPYGTLVKIVLRPDHQGAIIEYADAANAGKASLALEGHEIHPGRRLHAGTVPEMLRQKAEKRTDRIQVGKARGENDSNHPRQALPSRTASAHQQQQQQQQQQAFGPIKRPAHQTGRRGGLGQKRGFGMGFVPATVTSKPKPDPDPPHLDTTTPGSGGRKSNTSNKSNNDFRQLMTETKSSSNPVGKE